MQRVVRGRPPAKLAEIRRTRTKRWVEYYRNKVGAQPTDSDWRKFAKLLSERFNGLCGYCESVCKGDVDHFRPASKFPEFVYRWSNWVYACTTCNSRHKLDKWATHGYVSPCTRRKEKPPEYFFTFDLLTFEIVPRPGLGSREFQQAYDTIRDFRLNDYSAHLKRRATWIFIVAEALGGSRDNAKLIGWLMSCDREHRTLTRQYHEANKFL